MKIQYTLVRFIDHKTRQDIASYETLIQADDAWSRGGKRQDERIILQHLRDDGSVSSEKTILPWDYSERSSSEQER